MTRLPDYKAGKRYDLARAVADTEAARSVFQEALDAQVEAENAADFPVAIEAEDQNLSSFNYARAGLISA